MTDSAAQLATLRTLRATITDPTQAATLDMLITQLEATVAHHHAQVISGEAQVGAAVSGDLHGDIQTGGERYQGLVQVFFAAAGGARPDDEQREALASYLDSLARRCNRLRLTGVVDWE